MTHSLANRLTLTQLTGTQFVWFRVLFATIMIIALLVRLNSGLFAAQFVEPTIYFNLVPIEWLSIPAPGPGFAHGLLFGCFLGLAAMFWGGRPGQFGAGLFGVCYGYFFLLDSSNYNNHDYLILLLALLFTIQSSPTFRRREDKVPAWYLYLFKFQIMIVYIFGAIAKLNHDWISGRVTTELASRAASWPHVPELLTGVLTWSGFPMVMAWGGILIDGFVAPGLLFRKTRLFSIVILVAFHLMNFSLFDIGPFPWIMIGSLLFFVSASDEEVSEDHRPSHRMQIFVLVFCLFQILFPLRRVFYEGPTTWSYAGYRYSWLMMSFTKEQGKSSVKIVNTITSEEIYHDPGTDLTPRQVFHLGEDPVAVVRYAKFLDIKYADTLGTSIDSLQVFIDIVTSYNAWPEQKFINDVDLSEVSLSLTGDHHWVRKFQQSNDHEAN